MASLERALRKDLETTVKKARRVAEAGARKTVAQLGVGETEAPKHLSAEQRTLRTRLRAHGRQLGDRRDIRTGAQDTTHLVQECAYEHWHRMLFARFLAEANLLIEPASGVAITLDEAQELARERATDWLELASDYAERMLPQIFRKEDPVLHIALPPETRSELEDLLKGLSKPIFEAEDSLGWVYQFWQADKKEEVNKSEVKIGADELPAVTQLFTEDYMVLFLLHNTLGAWWAGKVLAANPSLATSARDEAALRAACKAGDTDWTYLRFIRGKGENGAEGRWRPAAGEFEDWPKAAKDLTVLDPCMGSGHFLVFALPILVAFRRAEEGLSQPGAIEAVLRDNLFGLEIDPRCTQIAAFNLAFAAWRRIGYRPLPQLNLACSGLAIGVTKAEWLKLAEKAVTAADPAAKRDLLGTEQTLLTVGLEERVKNGLEALYDLFAKAPWLGSLINPRRAGADILREGFDRLEPLLASIFAAADTDDVREMAVAAQGMARAAQLLSSKFTLVCTNVPYLGWGKQDELLQDFCLREHAEAKPDLSTCFVERNLHFTLEGGTSAAVTPQNWLFLSSYKKLRRKLLRIAKFDVVSDLGPAAFNEMNWWAARTALVVYSNKKPTDKHRYLAVYADTGRDLHAKPAVLANGEARHIDQGVQATTKDATIAVFAASDSDLLGSYADCFQGISPGDSSRLVACFWEIDATSPKWKFFQSPPETTIDFGGRVDVIDWDSIQAGFEAAAVRGTEAWGHRGIAIGQMRHIPATLYSGELFSNSTPVIVPKVDAVLPAIWAFCKSADFHDELRKVNPKVSVDNGYVQKVPFNLAHWQKRADEEFAGKIPAPNTDDPTQWIFCGRPERSKTPLQVALARLMGYQWPRGKGVGFSDCPAIGQDDLENLGNLDGIVCLTATKGEPPAEQRLNSLLAKAYDPNWSATKLASLLNETGYAGKSLDDWLRDGFFAQHCELFQQRPFIWHIWDGRRDGFHALINYHRLAAPNGEGRRTLEKLIYSYLGDWIDRQRAEQRANIEGADARLAHAEHLRTELIKILEGEPPYDIFVRWKELHEQPLGWDPDINDGVRMNIRPFMTARTLNGRGAGGCILRSQPKIRWDKDRGKEPTRSKADYPWFWSWDESTSDFAGGAQFDGNRWNDLHYSRATKTLARGRHHSSVGGKA
ncbi:Eco57I restriction-modification methylase domain-containing protein [Bradyrhizobium sp. WSM1743]|uniref:Eco57I restriction-modification methylase domain-containing protein n=1 Tax=Bradyrhizobium sp. WSM1743 TaxID=318996 RepID=UPI00048244C7|nr:hypothetical protein [Bradyrhizobium sp. WSM1743]